MRQLLRWLLGASFLLMTVWMLIPDKLEDDADSHAPKLGVFATTVVVFFLAEVGDKTQIAPLRIVHLPSALVFALLGVLAFVVTP